MPSSNFNQWKDKFVSELASRPSKVFTSAEAERHRIYSLALMSITLYYWNGNKHGRNLQYPLNASIPQTRSPKLADDYLGHNIAGLIVDGSGLIIDFDFNHNEIFNSSVEHAESRLLRRIFSLSQIQDSWDLGRKIEEQHYSTLLKKATLYTTLESCAQCSGIMALAQLNEVIFLQTDPGQYAIGNIMRNMTENTGMQAPSPIPASWFGFGYFSALDEAYQKFQNRPKDKENAMVLTLSDDFTKQSDTTSITSFLCTKNARDIFENAADEFLNFKVDNTSKDWKPDPEDAKQLTNAQVYAEAQQFVHYATIEARRGTPHRA